jgi:hypothetical protein
MEFVCNIVSNAWSDFISGNNDVTILYIYLKCQHLDSGENETYDNCIYIQ